MHLTTRSMVLRAWIADDFESFKRYCRWMARYHWNLVYRGVKERFEHPSAHPDATDEEVLEKLHWLLQSAIYLIRSADPREIALLSVSDNLELQTAANSALRNTDIDRIFHPTTNSATVVNFAFRRIVQQRVERSGLHLRGNARPLTRYFGRYEQKEMFFSLLLTPNGHNVERNLVAPVAFLSRRDQLQVELGQGMCSLNLGWLRAAERKFEDLASAYQSEGDLLSASRAVTLFAAARIHRGYLDKARNLIAQGLGMLKAGSDADHLDGRRRLISLKSRVALLAGEVESAAGLQEELLANWAGSSDQREVGRLLDWQPETTDPDEAEHLRGWLDATHRGLPVARTEHAMLGDRGRSYIEAMLAKDASRSCANNLLPFLYLCLWLSKANRANVDLCYFYILETCLWRLMGDLGRAAKSLQDADRVGTRFNVHMPVRLQWRLEKVRLDIQGKSVDSDTLRVINTVVNLAEDYAFRVILVDALILRALLIQESPTAGIQDLSRAEQLIERYGLKFRATDLRLARSGILGYSICLD